MEEEFTEKKKKKINLWTGIAAALAVLLIFNVVTGAFVLTGGLSKEQAAEKAIDFINNNVVQDGGVTLESVKEVNDMYELTVSYRGNNVILFVTKDGERLFLDAQPIDMTETLTQTTQESVDVPKTDKPEVELFIMSFCPYGTQVQKALIPVMELLGDKADIDIKFVYYLMHGEKELDENLRQHVIQKEYPEKHLDYLKCFLKGDGNADASGYIANGNDPELCMKEAGIDKAKVQEFMKTVDEEFKLTETFNDESKWLNGRFPLYNVDKELNEKYEIGGSPTLIVNGNEISVARSPEAIKQAVCNAFNTPPRECSEQLSSDQASPGFGFNVASGNAPAGECG